MNAHGATAGWDLMFWMMQHHMFVGTRKCTLRVNKQSWLRPVEQEQKVN